MPNECTYCGEYTLCREESMEPLGLGNCYRWNHNRLEAFNWVCKDCDKARAILRNEERLNELKKQKQNQLNWRKEKDKLLKRNGKR